jgi:hypothetical protein
LALAAQDTGLYPVVAENLTRDDLLRLRAFAILHVKASFESKRYGHFVLFAGVKNGMAVILDPPAVRPMSFPDLIRLWDGKAVIVSDKPVAFSRFLPSLNGMLKVLILALVFLALLFLRAFGPPLIRFLVSPSARPRGITRRFVGSVLSGSMISLVALVPAGLYHLFSDTGFFYQPSVIEPIIRAHRAERIKEIASEDEFQSLMSEKALVIDADPKDLPGCCSKKAIRIPADSDKEEQRRALEGIDRNTLVIVFSSDERHQSSSLLGDTLIKEYGFKRVHVGQAKRK